MRWILSYHHNIIVILSTFATVAPGLGAQILFFLAMSHSLSDCISFMTQITIEALDNPQSHASTYFSYEF